MAFRPVQKCQFKLRHALEHVGIIPAFAHFLFHVFADGWNACIACVGFIGNKQIQFRVLLDLHTEFVQALDWCIAGKEVLRTRAKGDNLEVFDTDNGSCDGDEVRDHLGDIVGSANRVFGDVALQMAHAEVIRTVQHAAVGIAAAVDEVAVALGGCDKHARAFKILGDERFGRFRAKVAEEDDEGIAVRCLDISNGFQHVGFVLDGDGTFVHAALASLGDVRAAHFGKRPREAVAGDGDEAKLDIGDVFKHDEFLLKHQEYQYFYRSGRYARRFLPRWSLDGPAATCCVL